MFDFLKNSFNKEPVKLIKKFQCPSCIYGNNPKTCGVYDYCAAENVRRCTSHKINTHIVPELPNGFNMPTPQNNGKLPIRFFSNGNHPQWNHFEIPVWAIKKDGFLFVRTYAPRINMGWIDVIENGCLWLCPNAINVADFYDKFR